MRLRVVRAGRAHASWVPRVRVHCQRGRGRAGMEPSEPMEPREFMELSDSKEAWRFMLLILRTLTLPLCRTPLPKLALAKPSAAIRAVQD